MYALWRNEMQIFLLLFQAVLWQQEKFLQIRVEIFFTGENKLSHIKPYYDNYQPKVTDVEKWGTLSLQ